MSHTLDRDQQILSRLAKIEHKVDSLDQTAAFALRAEEQKHIDVVKKIFKNGRRRAQVYLAANGQRSVGKIAEQLRMQQPNVSRELQRLADEGLLEIIDSNAGSNIWGKKPLDRTLRIAKFLRSEYGLDSDGIPVLSKKKLPKR